MVFVFRVVRVARRRFFNINLLYLLMIVDCYILLCIYDGGVVGNGKLIVC